MLRIVLLLLIAILPMLSLVDSSWAKKELAVEDAGDKYSSLRRFSQVLD